MAAIRGAISTGHVGDARRSSASANTSTSSMGRRSDRSRPPAPVGRDPRAGHVRLPRGDRMSGTDRRAALLGVVGAACLGLGTSASWGVSPRFLLPALAFACIPMALGVTWLWSASAVGKVASIGLAALILSWNVATLASVGRVVGQRRESVQRIGAIVATRRRGRRVPSAPTRCIPRSPTPRAVMAGRSPTWNSVRRGVSCTRPYPRGERRSDARRFLSASGVEADVHPVAADRRLQCRPDMRTGAEVEPRDECTEDHRYDRTMPTIAPGDASWRPRSSSASWARRSSRGPRTAMGGPTSS